MQGHFAINFGGCTMKWLRDRALTAIIVLGVLISALFLGLAIMGLWKLLILP